MHIRVISSSFLLEIFSQKNRRAQTRFSLKYLNY